MAKMTTRARRTAILALALAWPIFAGSSETRVEIESEGWQLVGDLARPDSKPLRAFALLLHKAAGHRGAYREMATALAAEGIASLRVDLRGHGESVNLGAFDPEISRYENRDDPAVVRNFELIRAGDRDIVAVMRWLGEQPDLAKLPLVVVGSSYTGEEMIQAAKATRFGDVYIALAPGNFSKESLAAVDPSGVPWLFVRAEVELPFFPKLFEAIREGSESAEIWLLPGEGHATDLFDHNPNLHLQLIGWINDYL